MIKIVDITGGSAASNFWYGSAHTNDFSSPRNQRDNIWTPTYGGNSLRFDKKDDSKASSVQSCSTPSTYPYLAPSRLGADNSVQVNNGGKSPGSCRLFGIELRNSSYIAPTLEKVTVCPENLSNGAKVTDDTSAGKADEVQNTQVAEPLKELNEAISDASQKETPTKQLSQSSTRSRTKVKFLSFDSALI